MYTVTCPGHGETNFYGSDLAQGTYTEGLGYSYHGTLTAGCGCEMRVDIYPSDGGDDVRVYRLDDALDAHYSNIP